MGKFSGILLASDYDGTLAAGDGTIPERLHQAIRAFVAEGRRFTVSTGRPLLGFRNLPWRCIHRRYLLHPPQRTFSAAQDFLADCPSLSFVPTEGTFPEVLRPGANKGTMLLRLAEILEIAPENVYVVKDDDNDANM